MQTSLKRLRAGGQLRTALEVEGDDFFARVDRGYAEIHAAAPERVHIVDSSRSVEAVFAGRARRDRRAARLDRARPTESHQKEWIYGIRKSLHVLL